MYQFKTNKYKISKENSNNSPPSFSPLLPPLLVPQGLQDECQYLLQPQLIVRRLLDVAVLVPGRPSEQTLSAHNRSALYK